MLLYLPHFISFLTGFILINILLFKEEDFSLLFKLVLGGGLGLGISSHLTFLSFILFNQYNHLAVICFHFLFLLIVVIFLFLKHKKENIPLISVKPSDFYSLLPLLFILVLAIPLWYQSNFYSHGGWDAWSTWNLKARFLFLGGENWRNMFDPSLWRSSPHYPILLPLINTWGWVFQKSATLKIPIMTAFIFTILSATLLFCSLKKITKSIYSIIPVIFLMTLPLLHKLSYSQYSDNIVGFYLLAGLICLYFAQVYKKNNFALLAGLFLGFLSFSKSEGFIAAGLIAMLTIPYLIFSKKNNFKKMAIYFIAGGILGGLPTLVFKLFYAPQNITFINGLVSQTNPSDLARLKMILGYYVVELGAPIWNLLTVTHIINYGGYADPKWSGIWIIILLTLVLSKGRCFKFSYLIFPLFFLIYITIFTVYYYVNTHFEIGWWLQVTLHRLLFALLPSVIFWSFASLWTNPDK